MDTPGSNPGQGSNQVGFYQDFSLQRWVQQRQALREMKAAIEQAERNMEYNLDDHIHRQNEVNNNGGAQISPQLLTTHSMESYTTQPGVPSTSSLHMPYMNATQVIDGSTRIVEVDSVSSSPVGPSNASRSISVHSNGILSPNNYSALDDMATRQNLQSSVDGSQPHDISNNGLTQFNHSYALEPRVRTHHPTLHQYFPSSVGDLQSYNIFNGVRTRNYALGPQDHAPTFSGDANWIPNDVADSYIPQLTQSHTSESPATSFPSRASQHQIPHMNVLDGRHAAPFTPSCGSGGDATGSIYFAIPPTSLQAKQSVQAGSSLPSLPTSVPSREFQHSMPHVNITPSYGLDGDDTRSILFATPPTSAQEKKSIQAGSSQPPSPPLQGIAPSLISAADNIPRLTSPGPDTSTATNVVNALVPVVSPSIVVNRPEIQETSPGVSLSPLAAINELLADHGQWSEDASNRILQSILESSDEPLNEGDSNASQDGEVVKDSEVFPVSSNLTREVFPDLQTLSATSSTLGTGGALVTPDNPLNVVQPANQLQVPELPVARQPPSPHTPAKANPDLSTLPLPASANKDTLARDIMRALRPFSTKRKRGDSDGSLLVSSSLSKRSKNAIGMLGGNDLPQQETLAEPTQVASVSSSEQKADAPWQTPSGQPSIHLQPSVPEHESKTTLNDSLQNQPLVGPPNYQHVPRYMGVQMPWDNVPLTTSMPIGFPQGSHPQQPYYAFWPTEPGLVNQGQPSPIPRQFKFVPQQAPHLTYKRNDMNEPETMSTTSLSWDAQQEQKHRDTAPINGFASVSTADTVSLPSRPGSVQQDRSSTIPKQSGAIPPKQPIELSSQRAHANTREMITTVGTSLPSQNVQQGHKQPEAARNNGFAPGPKLGTSIPSNEKPAPSPKRAPREPLFLPSSESPPPVSASSERPSNKIPVVELGPPLSKLRSKEVHLAKSNTPVALKPSKNGILPTRKQLYVLIPKLRGLGVAKDFKGQGMAPVSAKRVVERRRYEGDEEVPQVADFARRMIRRACLWKNCHAVLDSAEKLIKHTKLTHAKGDDDGIYRCHWTECHHMNPYAESDQLVRHLRWHVQARIYCAYQECEFQTQLAGQLAEHIAKEHDSDYDSLSPYALPHDAELPTTPPLVDQLPAYLSVPIPVTAKRITSERHQRIAPMILQRIFKKVDAKRNLMNVRLHLSRSSQFAISPEEAAQYAQDRDEYRLIRKEAPSKAFMSLIQLPPFIDDVDVLEGNIMESVMVVEHEKPTAETSTSQSDIAPGVDGVDNYTAEMDVGFTGIGPNLLQTFSVREETETLEVDKLL